MRFDDLLALSLIQGVGDKTLKKAISYSSANELLSMSEDELSDIFPNRKTALIFAESFDAYRAKANEMHDSMSSHNAYILHCENSKYPQKLLSYPDYPVFLYCKGNLDLLNDVPCCAISGPRKPSQKGIFNAALTAQKLTEHGFAVVSGLALGIDTVTHTSALKNGCTIAVLPFFSPIYPPQNNELSKRISENQGLMISPSYSQYNIKFQLLFRDKIIVNLSDSLYIPDCYETDSGTAYTVNYALKCQKTVYIHKNGKYTKLCE